jgi:hypothetical protein
MNTASEEASMGLRERIGELEDEIKLLDRRIAELKDEIDKERDLVKRHKEVLQDCDAMIEQWKQAFDMVQDETGDWVWREGFALGDKWFEKHQSLVRQWNRFVGEYNATFRPRNVGRPLAASETECAEVLRLRKAGASLREIGDEAGLGLQTVRTIIEGRKGTDRTMRKRMERIMPDKQEVAAWLAARRTRDALPRRLKAWEEQREELRKEAKVRAAR